MTRKKTDPAAKKTKNVMQNPTRGKNAGAQTNGQFERDKKHAGGRGQFGGAGDPPRMTK
jgi:hypothetical protein